MFLDMIIIMFLSGKSSSGLLRGATLASSILGCAIWTFVDIVDTVDIADIVHIVDTLDNVKSVNSVDNVSSVNSVHSVHNVQMAHPNMEDANVAPLNRPDDDFPDTNIIIIMSKNMGVACFGPKIHQNGKRGLDSGCHGPPELK